VQEYGTTAVVCVQKGEHLIIANVGDSKAILFREAAQGASSREKCVPNHG
jgi:serine/threonine protein phosphatase PrpC